MRIALHRLASLCLTKVGACAKMRKILNTAYTPYVREQLGYEHAHAHRLAVVGDLIARWNGVSSEVL